MYLSDWLDSIDQTIPYHVKVIHYYSDKYSENLNISEIDNMAIMISITWILQNTEWIEYVNTTNIWKYYLHI